LPAYAPSGQQDPKAGTGVKQKESDKMKSLGLGK